MRRRIPMAFCLTLALFSLSSCDYMDAGWKLVTDQIPAFHTTVPELFSGSYKILSSDGAYYTKHYAFSSDGSFTYEGSENGTVTRLSGTYSLDVRVYTENELAGYVTLAYSAGGSVTLPFDLTFDISSGIGVLVLNGEEYTWTGALEEAL